MRRTSTAESTSMSWRHLCFGCSLPPSQLNAYWINVHTMLIIHSWSINPMTCKIQMLFQWLLRFLFRRTLFAACLNMYIWIYIYHVWNTYVNGCVCLNSLVSSNAMFCIIKVEQLYSFGDFCVFGIRIACLAYIIQCWLDMSIRYNYKNPNLSDELTVFVFLIAFTSSYYVWS